MVVDASVVVAVLLGAPGDLSGRLATEEVHAPHLLDAEVLQALRRHAHRAEVGPELAIAAVDALGVVIITRHAHAPLRHRVWELRGNMTAYDALYVALAERLGIPLVTADARIAGCPGIRTTGVPAAERTSAGG